MAYGQPTVAGDAALRRQRRRHGATRSARTPDACTGRSRPTRPCARRSASAWPAPAWAIYFGDQARQRLRASTPTPARLLWKTRVDDASRRAHHRRADAGRRPAVRARLVERKKGRPPIRKYPCCTFRGSVSALDAATGAVIWKSYTIRGDAKARSQEPARRAVDRTVRRRSLVGADGRSGARHGVRHDRRQLLRSGRCHLRRVSRLRPEDRHAAVVAADDRRRRVHGGLRFPGRRSGRTVPTANGPDHDFGSSADAGRRSAAAGAR